MPNLSPDPDWQPVLLVKVTRKPFTGTRCGLNLRRVYLVSYLDRVVCVAWDVPPEQRNYPHAQLVGWKPLRDVPFDLPVRFVRHRDARVSALIPNGMWVLPYDDEQHRLCLRLR